MYGLSCPYAGCVYMCVCVCVLLQVTDMGIVLEVVEALEGITITANDLRVSS